MALVQRRERQAARRLLDAERRARAELRRATDPLLDVAVRAAGMRDGSAEQRAAAARALIRTTATSIASAVGAAVVAARRGAREAGLEDLEAPGAPIEGADEEDRARAIAASSSIAAAWISTAGTRVRRWEAEPTGSLAARLSEGADVIESRVVRTSATEAADAFNVARARVVDLDARRRPPSETAPRRIKVWSAILDLKTCPRCADMHGRTVLAGQPFSAGVAPIHPFCRCVIVVVDSTVSLRDLTAALRAA